MKIDFLFIATLAASAFAGPVVERQITPGLDGLINGLTTVVSNLVHGIYEGNLNNIFTGINSKSAAITSTQSSINNGDISKEDGQAKIDTLVKELQSELTSGAAKLQDAADQLSV